MARHRACGRGAGKPSNKVSPVGEEDALLLRVVWAAQRALPRRGIY